MVSHGFTAFVVPEVTDMLSNVSKTVATPPAGREAEDEEPRDDDTELVYYWQLPRAFTDSRHTEKIAAFQTAAQPWRMKERMKTVSVALVLCLNVGVDPPDIVKINPCARLECWVGKLTMPAHLCRYCGFKQ